MKNDDYCYLNPPYSTHAYMSAIFIMDFDNVAFIYPLLSIYSKLPDIGADIQEIVNYNSYDELSVADVAIVIPLELQTLYPLRKEFWKNPTFNYSEDYRLKDFLQFLAKPELYNLLVTPTYYEEQEDLWTLWATFPYFVTQPTTLVENFMLHSKHPVDTRAKNAAIYTCNTPKRFSWQTGEVSELLQDESLTDALTIH